MPLDFVRRLFTFPGPHVRRGVSSPSLGPDMESLWLDAPARVEAWLLKPDGASARNPRPLIMFAHGNAELIDDWPGPLSRYLALGYHVLLPEFRGYGRSAGTPSEAGIRDDVLRFLEMVSARPDVDATRIAYHGRSIGGGVVCSLLEARAPRALILQSTFSSIHDVAKRWHVPKGLLKDTFESATRLAHYTGPTLILQGTRDTLITPDHAERLHRVRPDAELVYFDADHNTTPMDPRRYWPTVEAFLVRAFA